jgi:hypothetical protein
MGRKLSPAMVDALARIRGWGGSAYRWPGGYWCASTAPAGRTGPPTEWISPQTIGALSDKGWLRIETRLRSGDPASVKIIERSA